MDATIRLGTRGSNLALKQAEIVIKLLRGIAPNLNVERVVIKTSGDMDQTSTLDTIGGKGIFIKELEDALINNDIDLAVHSFKDITSQMPAALELIVFLPPESTRDVLISQNDQKLNDLPKGALVGTGSLRRQMFLHQRRPDLKFTPIRGNVETRIKKLQAGEVAAIVLSEAGLIRLNLRHHIAEAFEPDTFLPAPGQGVIALQVRKDLVPNVRKILLQLTDKAQAIISNAEYRFMQTIGFNCRIPLGLLTHIRDNKLHMKAAIAGALGTPIVISEGEESMIDALVLAENLAKRVMKK